MRSRNKCFSYRVVLCLLANLLLTSSTKDGLLPRNLIPEHYDLEIKTNMVEAGNKKFTFEGKVNILIKCLQETNTIVLNALDITIEKKVVVMEQANSAHHINVNEWFLTEQNEILTINLDTSLKAGSNYNLNLQFSGNITDKLVGYFRSSYVVNKSKQRRWLAVTQFQPTHARRAFPCFDEPSFKATFQISIGRLGVYSSLSNMPIDKTEPMKNKKGWFWDRYKKTLKMSTYLVAYIVSDFKYTTAQPIIGKSGFTFRIWAREDALYQTEFAKEAGPKMLDFFENFLNNTYPISKKDMVAVPDFKCGAMENWGLVTYRENMLLLDPKLNALSDKVAVANIIAHEMAHQWFGNLVTMKWWTDLWLNEGFATYMSALAVNHVYHKWKSFDDVTVNNLLLALSYDSFKDSHPISMPLKTSSEISAIFDTTTYKKGASLIFMIVNFMEADTFKKAISDYLVKHQYGNVKQDDFFESFATEAHKIGSFDKNMKFKTVMDTWTLQAGYPVITVHRNYENGSVKITQNRFYQNPDALPTNECWWIPLSFTNQREQDFGNTLPKKWLPCPKCELIINKVANKTEWVLFNLRGSAFYRVNYDDKNWEMLVSALNGNLYRDVPIINRAQLIDDSASLAAASKLSYKYFFGILKYLKKEIRYLPWTAAAQRLNYLHIMLRYTSIYGSFEKFVRNIVEPVEKKLKSKRQTTMEAVKFKTVTTLLSCKYNAGTCRGDAVKFLNDYVKDSKMTSEQLQSKTINNEMWQLHYCYGIQSGGEKEWNFLWKKYNETNTGYEKNIILRSLACTRVIWLLQRYLEWTLDDNSGIRKHDRLTVFTAVAQNDVGYNFAKLFFEDHIQQLYEGIKPNFKALSSYLMVIAEQITTVRELDWLKKFVVENKELFSEIRTEVQRALESATINTRWHKLYLKDVRNYL